MFITLPNAPHYNHPRAEPTSIIKVRYDAARYSHPVGYCQDVHSVADPATMTHDFYAACASAADAADAAAGEVSTLSAQDIADADAAADDARSAAAALSAAEDPGWLQQQWDEHFNARNEDGERAVGHGGISDFVSNFWGSATAETHEGAEWGATQEEKEEARDSKPSNN